MSARHAFLLCVWFNPLCSAAVFVYEGTSFPDEAGFVVGQNFCDPDEWLADGCFFQFVDLCIRTDPPSGQQSSYERSLVDFVSHESMFFEWKMETDGDRDQIPFGAPTAFTLGSGGGKVIYTFFIASDQAKLFRDTELPVVFVDIRPGSAHVFRLELEKDRQYRWYIDGFVIDSASPQGPYPSGPAPFVRFRSKYYDAPSTNLWHYIRWGDIPLDASGDFDSSGIIDQVDATYVEECILRGFAGELAEPSCSWADMDGDNKVTCADGEAILQLWAGPGPAPQLAPCVGIPAVSNWGMMVMAGLVLAAGAVLYRSDAGAKV